MPAESPKSPFDIDPDLLGLATPAELEQYERALMSELALASPADYAEAVSGGGFLRPRHIDLISDALTALVEGKLTKADGTPYKKMMVSVPPRHGKSHLISTYTPAWFLTKYPNRHVAVAGYEADFAASWGRKVRDILVEAPAGLAPPLREDAKAANRWLTKAGGSMFTAGVGGPLTGKGAHLLLIDDPVKNFEDARSETKREAAYNWALSTALTRLEPGGVAVLVMTRWHEADLAGRFLEDEPGEWYQIVLPALAKDNDPLGRAPGEALWPERYDVEELEGLRQTMGSQIFASLYQQEPFIEGGGLFRTEKVRFFTRIRGDKGDFLTFQPSDAFETTPLPTELARLGRFGVVDLAASTKTSADFSVFSHWGVTADKQLLLLDSFRARIEGADHMATLERLHNLWQPRFWGIERATFGLTLLQTAARTGRIPVRELKPDSDKVSRAFAGAALLEAGRLWFPKGAPFLEDWLGEMEAFPNGRNDDCVDCLAYASKLLSDRLTGPSRPRAKEPQTVEEWIEHQRDGKKRRSKFHPVLGRY